MRVERWLVRVIETDDLAVMDEYIMGFTPTVASRRIMQEVEVGLTGGFDHGHALIMAVK